MNIEDTLAPNSDQLDAIELVAGPRVFKIESVSKGNAEQPVNVHLAGFPRPWRPGKSMRRVLAACWGTDASVWADRFVELFCDPEVTFGKDKVGGTRVSRLSHIDEAKKIPLLVTRGKSAVFTVQPLPKLDQLKAEWRTADPAARAVYDELYAIYRELHDLFGGVRSDASAGTMMKRLLNLKERVS